VLRRQQVQVNASTSPKLPAGQTNSVHIRVPPPPWLRDLDPVRVKMPETGDLAGQVSVADEGSNTAIFTATGLKPGLHCVGRSEDQGRLEP
jgi:hypothetical protein